MSLTALALALGAAFLHAFWNLILARAKDVDATTAVALIAGVLAFAPVAAIGWEAQREVWPFLVVTSLLQLTYFVLLATAYGRAELSFVYPIARGAAPVLVLIAGVIVLGYSASATQIGGVVLVVVGVLCVRGLRAPTTATDLALALAIGACIASYTLLDQRGIRYASPVVYQELSMIVPTIGFVALTLVRRGRAPIRAAVGLPAVAAGLFAWSAYVLVLAALARASAASVAAVRETSVVIATVLAVPFLHERVGPARMAGAVLVVVGVALLVS